MVTAMMTGADDGRIAERGQAQPLQPEAQGPHAFWFGLLLHFPLIRFCCWRGYSKDRAPALAAGSNQMGEIRLEIERGLHLPQFAFQDARASASSDCSGLGRIGDVLFGVLDGLSQHCGIELCKVDGGLGKHGEAGSTHPRTGSSAPNKVASLLAAIGEDLQQPGPQAGQDRRMMGEHGEVALRARHDNLLDIGRDEQTLRRARDRI